MVDPEIVSATVSGDFTLRAMTTADVPAVLALERALFPHDAWPESFFYDELALAQPAQATAQISSTEYPTRRYWVVESAEALTGNPVVVGYAGMMCVLPLADVQTIAVAPAAQGKGLGSRLLAVIEAESTRRGAEDLLLEVRADNPGAQRLYRRVGFEQIHLRRGYYPDGGDALIMRKHLAAPAQSTASNLRGDLS